MKVILQKDIKGLGKKGDIVTAKDGYARNYLLPKGLVVEANQGNITKVKEQNKAKEIRKERELEESQKLAEKISKTTITIKERAAEDGRLFGSVTSKDIAGALQSQKNMKIDKRKINLVEPIRHIGDMSVEIKIHKGISAKLNVKVEAKS